MTQRIHVAAQYTPVTVKVPSSPDFDAVVWMNRHSALVGMTATAQALRVPGYLVNGNPDSRVHLDSGKALVTHVGPDTPAWVTIPARLRPRGRSMSARWGRTRPGLSGAINPMATCG